MKNLIKVFSLATAIFVMPVLSSAKPVDNDNFITGNGNVVKQTRLVTSFHDLKVSGEIDVELIQGKEIKLQVEADENLIEFIRTEVKDGTLCIYSDKSIKNAKKMMVYCTFQNLDAITASGGCDIISKQKLNFSSLQTDLSGGCDVKITCNVSKLYCKLSGGCDMVLSGEAENCTFTASGGCDIKASGLRIKNCTVDASGGSDVSVYATGELTIKASGASDITYSGNPRKVMKNADKSSDIKGR
ncbi:MAG: DUF2807 domain-containing protein [Lentimicrobiaceae bacterium]|nr:DUF2807 domain-containing protein [Lentimicrobiaceae bacterium]